MLEFSLGVARGAISRVPSSRVPCTRSAARAARSRTAERPAAEPSGPESADVVDLTSSPDENLVKRLTALPPVNRKVFTQPKPGCATQRPQAKAVPAVSGAPLAVRDIVASMRPKGSDDKPSSPGSGPSEARPIRKAEPMEEGEVEGEEPPRTPPDQIITTTDRSTELASKSPGPAKPSGRKSGVRPSPFHPGNTVPGRAKLRPKPIARRAEDDDVTSRMDKWASSTEPVRFASKKEFKAKVASALEEERRDDPIGIVDPVDRGNPPLRTYKFELPSGGNLDALTVQRWPNAMLAISSGSV